MSRFLFTPKTLVDIREYVAAGKNGPQIAKRLGCQLGSLHVICSQHGISLRQEKADPRDDPEENISLTVPWSVLQQFRREAKVRGLTVDALGRRVLEYVATDNLFQAILDF